MARAKLREIAEASVFDPKKALLDSLEDLSGIHMLRYNELLAGIRRTNARYLIIDTFSPYMMGPVPNVNVITEFGDQEGAAAADTYTHGPSVLVGRPNLAAIRTMLGAYGYRVERLSDWAGLLRDNPAAENCGDYANQKRITARCVSASTAPA